MTFRLSLIEIRFIDQTYNHSINLLTDCCHNFRLTSSQTYVKLEFRFSYDGNK